MPSGHHPPVLDQAGAHGSSGQSAVKTGFAPSAIPIKPSPGKLAAAPNPHRRPSLHRFSAGSFFGGFRTPALLPGIPLAPARHPKPFPKAAVETATKQPNRYPSPTGASDHEVAASAALGYGPRLTKPKAAVLAGKTAKNGKNQFLDPIRGLLPPGAVSSLPLGKFGEDRYIVQLAGKLLNASDELSSAAPDPDRRL